MLSFQYSSGFLKLIPLKFCLQPGRVALNGSVGARSTVLEVL